MNVMMVFGSTTGQLAPQASPEEWRCSTDKATGLDLWHLSLSLRCTLLLLLTAPTTVLPHTRTAAFSPSFFFFFLKVCSACYHEWAPGLRNPITSSVSEHCCHSHVYRSHVPQIRNDVPISCSSLLQFSLPPLTQCVSLIEAAVHLRGCCSAHSDSDSASSTAGASTGWSVCLRLAW